MSFNSQMLLLQLKKNHQNLMAASYCIENIQIRPIKNERYSEIIVLANLTNCYRILLAKSHLFIATGYLANGYH